MLSYSPIHQAEMLYKNNPKMLDQYQFCEDHFVPLCLTLGEDELKQGLVTVRNVATRKEEKIKREELVQYLADFFKSS